MKMKSVQIMVFCFSLAFLMMLAGATLAAKTTTKNGTTIVRQATQTKTAPKTTQKARQATKKTSPVAKTTAQNTKQDDEVHVDEDSLEEKAQELEKNVLNSMLATEESEKSEFIQNEDKRENVKLGDAPKTNFQIGDAGETQSLNMTNMFVKMGIATAILGLCVFLLAALYKFIQTKSLKLFPGTQGQLRIVSQQAISTKSKIMIIEALGKRYLVGATEHNIQLLSDLEFFDAGETATENQSQASSDQMQWSSVLEQASHEDDAVVASFKSRDEFQPHVSKTVLPVSSRVRERLKNLKKLS